MYTAGILPSRDMGVPAWVRPIGAWQGVPASFVSYPSAMRLSPSSLPAASQGRARQSEKPANALVVGGLAYGAGLLLRGLPTHTRSGKHWLPSDWKMFARPLLGVYAVAQVNKALGWQPAPWLQGVETMSAITPLMSGMSRYGVGQWLVHAPLIGALVQGAHQINQAVAKPLKEDYGLPVLATRLMTSAILTAVGYWAIPPITRNILKMPLSKRWFPPPKEGTVGAALAGAMTTCARGCTPGGILCMSELSELLGSLGLWAHGKDANQKPVLATSSVRQSARGATVRFGRDELPEAPTPEEQALMDAMENQMKLLYQKGDAASAPAPCCASGSSSTSSNSSSCCEVSKETQQKTLSRSEQWKKSSNPLKRFLGRFISWGKALWQSLQADFKSLMNPASIQKSPQGL